MKLVSNLIIAASLIAVIACKDTKQTEEEAAAATIEKVEEAEAELDAVTQELEQKAKELDDSLSTLDEI